MIDHFPDNPHELDELLGEFARDMGEHEAFQTAKEALYAQIALLYSGNIHEDLEQSIAQLAEFLDEHVDKFVALSHTILSRSDKDVAVGEWIKLITADDLDQQARTFEITKLELLPPLERTRLSHYAWSYIKQNRLDKYEEYGLGRRTDLDGEEWVTEGYQGRQYRRVKAILDYAPEFITAAVEESDLDDSSL